MSEEKNDLSPIERGKNLAKFSWDLINYMRRNQTTVLFVSDEIYKERMNICKGCEKYNEFENMCKECGCYVPAKAKIIMDSCPLDKWKEDPTNWEQTFNYIIDQMEEKSNKDSGA
jgi:hypothetical protein